MKRDFLKLLWILATDEHGPVDAMRLCFLYWRVRVRRISRLAYIGVVSGRETYLEVRVWPA